MTAYRLQHLKRLTWLLTPNRIICLLCVYICHYILPFYYLDIYLNKFLSHWHRKRYYIKLVENMQIVCTENSGISRDLCNANTYRSIHEGIFFNSSPALDLKYPLRFPLSILSLFASFILYNSWPPFINISANQIDSYILYGRGGYSGHMINYLWRYNANVHKLLSVYFHNGILCLKVTCDLRQF